VVGAQDETKDSLTQMVDLVVEPMIEPMWSLCGTSGVSYGGAHDSVFNVFYGATCC